MKNRISKANKSMGALKFAWNAAEVLLIIKKSISSNTDEFNVAEE